MPFSTNEKISKVDKLSLQISGSADDSPGAKYWYSEDHPWVPIIPPYRIWSSFSSIPGAGTPALADLAVTNNPTILEKRTIRLTLNITSNNRQYEARSTYGDRTTAVYGDWIQPSLIRNSGESSNGYIIRLFNGDPDNGGEELPTTYLSGSNGEPSWEWNYATGLLKVSTDQRSTYGTMSSLVGLWVVGYRYIGPTGGGTGSNCVEVLKGNGNPNGVVTGVAGQTYIDEMIDIFYKCTDDNSTVWVVD